LALTKEEKLARQFCDTLADVRFSTTNFGQIIAGQEPIIQRNTIQLFCHTAEMIDLNYQFGNFYAGDLPYLRVCHDIVQLLGNHYQDPI
jgi:hypothetical protein